MDDEAAGIPTGWSDITTHWVTRSIAGHFPGAEVGTLRTLMRDDGTNRRLRLELSYVRGSGPKTLFLKANEPAHRAVHLRNGNLFNEAQLFSSGASLPIHHPDVYEAIADREGGNFLLVMEDLNARDADPRDATRPLSVEQVASGLRGLASLHGHYWGISKTSHPNLAWLQTWEASQGWQVGLRKHVPIGLQRAAGLLPAEISALSGDDVVGLWSRYVSWLGKGEVTLLHGDAHIGNTYVLPDGEVGFLDWQVVRRGSWSQDVGYFIVGALAQDDRRHAERDLLDEYLKALRRCVSQPPSPQQIWMGYRCAPAYGLAVWLSTLGTDGYQTREISLTLAQRYACAFVDLQTRQAVDNIPG